MTTPFGRALSVDTCRSSEGMAKRSENILFLMIWTNYLAFQNVIVYDHLLWTTHGRRRIFRDCAGESNRFPREGNAPPEDHVRLELAHLKGMSLPFRPKWEGHAQYWE